jgi:hypothetical protein
MLYTNSAIVSNPIFEVIKIKIVNSEGIEKHADTLIRLQGVFGIKGQVVPKLAGVTRDIEGDFETLVSGAEDLFLNIADPETIVLLGRKDIHERIKFDVNVEDLHGRASATATYPEIKAYVLEKFGLKVSSLYIAQIKEKCGLDKRENFNIGEGKSRPLICPPEKEQAIMDAFRHFGMIDT